MPKNEKGTILPMMIAITFIVAYLLVMLATQLEVRVASYARTRIYMTMNVLEQEGLDLLEDFLATTDIPDYFSETWSLRNGAIMTVNGIKREDSFDFYYQIVYNGNMYSQRFSVSFVEHANFILLE